jgi:hypothetical protein
LWGGLFSGAAGTGMVWWWDEHVDLYNGYPHFRAVANFVKDIAFNREAFVYQEKSSATAAPLQVFELVGRHTRLLWVRHPELSWYAVAVEKKAIKPIPKVLLTVRDLTPGSYKVEIWDSICGKIISTTTMTATGTSLDIPLENVQTELALKVMRQ